MVCITKEVIGYYKEFSHFNHLSDNMILSKIMSYEIMYLQFHCSQICYNPIVQITLSQY